MHACTHEIQVCHFNMQLLFPACSLTWLHCSASDPTGSQLQASQPIPLAIFQWLSLHWSQFKPITFGLQEHCPVLRLHGPASTSVPSKLHVHSAGNNPLCVKHYIRKLKKKLKKEIKSFLQCTFHSVGKLS